MSVKVFPVIDLVATGDNIRRLRLERGMTVRALQNYFGFEEPRAIYKWQKGESLPSVDNLYALGTLFEVPMEQILIPAPVQLHRIGEQQASACCSQIIRFSCDVRDTRMSSIGTSNNAPRAYRLSTEGRLCPCCHL